MYRRVNSGRFIVLTTAGIVIIMAIFTWVMYGMAQQVFTMTDVMVELGQDFNHMVDVQDGMAKDMHSMSQNIALMNQNIAGMSNDITNMSGDITGMGDDISVMSGSIQSMNANVGRMTYDISKATYAFSQPMSYIWGSNPFGF